MDISRMLVDGALHLAIAFCAIALAYFLIFPSEQVTLAKSLYGANLLPESAVNYYPSFLAQDDVDIQYYDNKTVITINKRLDPNSAMCTGSMHPYIGCGNLILTEELSLTDRVNIGDIVVYKSGSTKISHQIVGYNGKDDCYYLKGTNAASQDPVCVQRKDILARQVLVLPTQNN